MLSVYLAVNTLHLSEGCLWSVYMLFFICSWYLTSFKLNCPVLYDGLVTHISWMN